MRHGARALLLLALAALALPAAAAPPPLPATVRGARIVVAFANPAHSAPAPAGTTGTRYGGGAYRVAQDAQAEARRVARHYALQQLSSWPIEALSMHCVVYEIEDGRSAADVLALLRQDAAVILAQPLQEFHTLSEPAPLYNDPLYDLQTNLTALNIPQAHARSQGAGLKVALIDTAVDATHPDLRGRILRTHSFVPEGAAAGARHGTAMAGIIAAAANNHLGIVGIAPLAQIEVFAACWQLTPASDAAACNTFTLAQALAAALASGAPLVNLSIGGPQDPLLSALVQQGEKRGITFVGALPGTQAGFPTSVAGVFVAGGSEHPLPPGAYAAPAEHVLTTLPGAQYDFESGSSVAAAELSGVIALLISAAPTHLKPETIAALLHERGAAGAQGAAIDAAAALARLADSPQRMALAAHSAP